MVWIDGCKESETIAVDLWLVESLIQINVLVYELNFAYKDFCVK